MKVSRGSSTLLARMFIAMLLGACASATRQPPPITSSTTSTSQNGTVITADMIGRSRGTMVLARRATDAAYAYSEGGAVKIGGGFGEGSDRTYQFLNSLRGPNGEALQYDRVGTCCPFKAPSSPFGEGVLEVFTLTYPGLSQPKRLYFNWYEEEEALIPVGLTVAN